SSILLLCLCLLFFFFLFNDPAPTEIYTLSLHDALPILVASLLSFCASPCFATSGAHAATRARWQAGGATLPAAYPSHGSGKNQRSEEHTSELQSLTNLVCRLLLEKKKKTKIEQCHSTVS